MGEVERECDDLLRPFGTDKCFPVFPLSLEFKDGIFELEFTCRIALSVLVPLSDLDDFATLSGLLDLLPEEELLLLSGDFLLAFEAVDFFLSLSDEDLLSALLVTLRSLGESCDSEPGGCNLEAIFVEEWDALEVAANNRNKQQQNKSRNYDHG